MPEGEKEEFIQVNLVHEHLLVLFILNAKIIIISSASCRIPFVLGLAFSWLVPRYGDRIGGDLGFLGVSDFDLFSDVAQGCFDDVRRVLRVHHDRFRVHVRDLVERIFVSSGLGARVGLRSSLV